MPRHGQATGERLPAIGLSVPVSEILDPVLWRRRYAYSLVLGPEVQDRTITRFCNVNGLAPETAQEYAQRFGEDLVKATDEIPNDVIRWHLRAALSELEVMVGVPMGIVVVKTVPIDEGEQVGVTFDRIGQRLPYTHSDAYTYFRIDLPEWVISVQRVRAFYFGSQVFEWSPEGGRDTTDQIRLEHDTQGSTHILPLEFRNFVVTQGRGGGGGDYGFWHTIAARRTPLPDFWAVDYTVGPRDRQTGQTGHLPAVVAHWVYAQAGQVLLSIGGAARSQGLTSTSVSFDGFSKSVGLQASAIYGLNSATEHVYELATKRLDVKKLSLALKGIRVRPYGH